METVPRCQIYGTRSPVKKVEKNRLALDKRVKKGLSIRNRLKRRRRVSARGVFGKSPGLRGGFSGKGGSNIKNAGVKQRKGPAGDGGP